MQQSLDLRRRLIGCGIVGLAVALAVANASHATAGKESEKSATDTESAVQMQSADGSKEFKPPPGFKQKRRGKIVLYCIRDSTVGTRLKTEKCYDEEQMRAYILAREQNNRDFDQRRSICQNPQACGMP